MPTKDEDIAYYRRRIDACADQAMRAETPAARYAHETLARLYREKLAALGAGPSGDGGEGTENSLVSRQHTSQDGFSADNGGDVRP